LAEVLRALQSEDARGRNTVFGEELGLELALREVLEQHARAHFQGKALDESDSLLFLCAAVKIALIQELLVLDELHVRALAQSGAQGCLTSALRADDAGDLRQHCAPGVFVNLEWVTVGVDDAHLAELLVVGDHGHVLGLESFETLLDSLRIVVGAALSTLENALGADVLRAVEEENVLRLADVGLEVGALVDFSGEAVNKIVLI